MPDDLTLGEVGRRLDDFRADVVARLVDVNRKIEGLGDIYVTREVYRRDMQQKDAEIADLRSELAEDREKRTWLTRSAVGAGIVALVGILVQIIQNVPAS